VTTALIIGSGPAAAGAALALTRHSDVKVTVIDVGLQLEAERRSAVEMLSRLDPAGWDDQAVRLISDHPVPTKVRGVPQKLTYGSDFPYRNVGQLDGVSSAANVNESVISAAYGGFSNVWGSQIMPFAASVFRTWPVSMADMEPHYRAILGQIPFAGEVDDLAGLFPILGQPAPLPQVSPRTTRVLAAYARHRRALNGLGVTLGKARLAFNAPECVRCGLCMSGCPYSLIYSASQTFDELRRTGLVSYHDGLIAFKIVEDSDTATVLARKLSTGQVHRFEADLVFVACGAIGTTRLVANSLDLLDTDLSMKESQQFLVPMLSMHPTRDPRAEPSFTLNQFNMIVSLDDVGLDVSQLHFYTYDPAFIDALPRPLRARWAELATRQVLRRLSVAFGYLPSWHSPSLLVRAAPGPRNDGLPDMQVTPGDPPVDGYRMLRTVLRRVLRSGRMLDLYPALPAVQLAGTAKSYHWGGSFPHAREPLSALSSDRLGRVTPWQRIHLVDASVFPNVPATTFTLTVMANAHRIASETLDRRQ
jgi:choline dehydrogenase-like flavoprotein